MQRPACSRLQLRRRLDDIDSRPDRALGVVLVRLRIAEIGEHAVAHVFGDEAAVARDQRRAAFVIGGDDLAHVLGIEPRGERRRADEIAEHHGQLAALGDVVGGRVDLGDWLTWRALPISAAQTCDRLEQPLSVAHEHAELFEIRVREVRQDFDVDFVFAERGFIPGETEVPKPSPDVHGRLHSARQIIAPVQSVVKPRALRRERRESVPRSPADRTGGMRQDHSGAAGVNQTITRPAALRMAHTTKMDA